MAAPHPDREPTDDATLMARIARGDRQAFDTLAARHLPRALAVARHILSDPSDAEEVAQDALLRLWTGASRFDPARAAVTTWLHRITLNLALDRRRRALRTRPARPLEDAAEIADTGTGALAVLEHRQLKSALAEGLRALPERQRAAFALTYAQELPAAEAAGTLGVSPRALEGLLRRARLFLRDWVQTRNA
jgi:RNA polymerase sigma-70 factor (ECF subfamily)